MQTKRLDAEWLETDGLGGFASGTVGGVRTRRYHALLLAAARPPVDRFVLVNGFDATVTTAGGTAPISTQRYQPGVIHPDGLSRLEGFTDDPWPTWTFRLEDGTAIEQAIVVTRGAPRVAISWKRVEGAGVAVLEVRPFLSGRDYHSLHHENPDFRFAAEGAGERLVWRPYDGVPAVAALHNGAYEADPAWYRGFLYQEEQARGLDHVEDLASPGRFRFDLARGEAVLILSAPDAPADARDADAGEADTHETTTRDAATGDAAASLAALRATERRRRRGFASRLHRAADDYIVRRGAGATILAGYPWFADWGRDTFIALRGLCLATGRLDEAGGILETWAAAVSSGMLPNRFPDRGDEPEFNAVDAALWYVVAVHDYLSACAAAGRKVAAPRRRTLAGAVAAIVAGYARGTRYGIRMDDDGLLAAGVPGVQLTWMDARVGDRVITPRIGKPVEIQALWINALRIAAALAEEEATEEAPAQDAAPEHGDAEASGATPPDWRRVAAAFATRFWNDAAGCLHDVVDADHRPGAVDDSLRPNQILAVGGLPFALLEGERARRVVATVEARLLTPLGLRTLAPGSPGYAARYEGGVAERDGVYHQGTAWPWLLGPFVEAWVRVRGGTGPAIKEARERFLLPLTSHMAEAGLGHISEIADAEPPHTPRGCPFQAWSVGEALRLSEQVLRLPKQARVAAGRARAPESRDHAPASVRP